LTRKPDKFDPIMNTFGGYPAKLVQGDGTMQKPRAGTGSAASLAEAAAELATTFTGQLLRPGDPGYEEARKVHNGLVDKRPTLIARCRGVADIAEAVGLARHHNLEVAVRGGGHNVAGRATVEGGLMIDLSPMTGIHVDPRARTARAQGGVTWGAFNRDTQLHGLATTGGVVSTTGIAGLTLGGGIGWLMGQYGLALDNLTSVELVTADGRVLQVSANENADLFWAVRGGGGNFGIAASFEYRLHSLGPMITGGLVCHEFSSARDVLNLFREVCSSASDSMMLVAALLSAPDGSGAKLAAIAASHCGPLSDGEAAMHRLKSFGRPVLDTIEPMTYCGLNTMLDAGYPKGALNYWKSHFLRDLSDDAIETMIDAFAKCPSPMSGILLEHFHGAAARVPVGDTAFPLRLAGYNLLVLSQWTDPADNEPCINWARQSYAAMQPFVGAGRYSNYLDDDEPGDPSAAAYGPNYHRLRELKAKYDPENFFHVNQNIRPLP
jgi:FAD/FMN-containing dehydrogenase